MCWSIERCCADLESVSGVTGEGLSGSNSPLPLNNLLVVADPATGKVRYGAPLWGWKELGALNLVMEKYRIVRESVVQGTTTLVCDATLDLGTLDAYNQILCGSLCEKLCIHDFLWVHELNNWEFSCDHLFNVLNHQILIKDVLVKLLILVMVFDHVNISVFEVARILAAVQIWLVTCVNIIETNWSLWTHPICVRPTRKVRVWCVLPNLAIVLWLGHGMINLYACPMGDLIVFKMHSC